MVRKAATQGLDTHRHRHAPVPHLTEPAHGTHKQIRASYNSPVAVSQATGSGHRPFVKSENGYVPSPGSIPAHSPSPEHTGIRHQGFSRAAQRGDPLLGEPGMLHVLGAARQWARVEGHVQGT